MNSNPKHILISRCDNIGDVVLTLPMAAAIKKAWPKCKITIIAREYVQNVADSHPAIDNFVNWSQLDSLPIKKAEQELKQLQADAILHVLPKRKIAQLAKAAGIKIRIGTKRRWYHWIYCNRLVNFSRKNSQLHEAQLNMLLLKGLELPNKYSLNDIIPLVKLTPEAANAKLQKILNPEKFNLVLHPLSHGHGKEWPLKNFAELCRMLDPEKYNILVTGSADEGQRFGGSELLNLENVNSLCGKLTLSELLSLLAECDGVVASGTGPLHMAAACSSNTLGLFPKKLGIDAVRWGPVGKKTWSLSGEKSCEKCISNGEEETCMHLITAKQVMQVINSWNKK